MPGSVLRNSIVRYFGTPDKTEGSVNEPREREENGVRFNEKWHYTRPLRDPSNARERVIYWRRYDYVGSLIRIGEDTAWVWDGSLAAVLPPVAEHKE